MKSNWFYTSSQYCFLQLTESAILVICNIFCCGAFQLYPSSACFSSSFYNGLSLYTHAQTPLWSFPGCGSCQSPFSPAQEPGKFWWGCTVIWQVLGSPSLYDVQLALLIVPCSGSLPTSVRLVLDCVLLCRCPLYLSRNPRAKPHFIRGQLSGWNKAQLRPTWESTFLLPRCLPRFCLKFRPTKSKRY